MAIDDKLNNYEEITGDKQTNLPLQFEKCWMLVQNGDSNCNKIDSYGFCTLETCIYKENNSEYPNTCDQWWFNCVICGQPSSIAPKDMKIHWCQSCIDRANKAEHLPFTCRYCGKQQYKPSSWMFSRVCDECIKHLYNKNCKNYAPTNLSLHEETPGSR